MTALQTVTEELARLRAELEDLPEDAFGRRADLRGRQQELRAMAAELRRVEEERQTSEQDAHEGGAEMGQPIDLTEPGTIDIRDAQDDIERELREQQRQSTV